MKKTHAIFAAGLACLAYTPIALADTSNDEIEQLKQQIQYLMTQNQLLSQRIGEQEKGSQAYFIPTEDKQQPPELQAVEHRDGIEKESARQVEGSNGQQLISPVTLSGLIEGSTTLAHDYQGSSSTTFNLDTVDFIVDIKPTDWAAGQIVLAYDSDDEDITLDEAHVTLGKTGVSPFFLKAGKVYAPFGDFTTNMIQDPFTQTLGEINTEGLIVGFEQNGFAGSFSGYDGVTDRGSGNSSNGFGVSLGYGYEEKEMSISVGMAWVNNIANAAGIYDVLSETNDNEISLAEKVPGINMHLNIGYKAFSFITEYTSALDSFMSEELLFGSGGAQPKAWNNEIAYTTELLSKETIFALGYQKSWESLLPGLPEYRYSISAAMAIYHGTTLNIEYYTDKDYSAEEGGTDGEGYGVITRLAYAW